MAGMLRRRLPAAAMAGLAAVAAAAIGGATAPTSRTVMTCRNPVSGAAWQIVVDFGHATVDANRARISPAEISWFDPKDGGNYTLDRRSGELTATVASSTGGYFRHGRCVLAAAR